MTNAAIRNARIQAALSDFHVMNTDRQWARVVVNGQNIMLQYGAIHSNGMEEIPIGERYYTWIGERGVVTTQRHICG